MRQALSVTQRALRVTQQALSVTQRALSITQRALRVTQQALSVTQRALSWAHCLVRRRRQHARSVRAPVARVDGAHVTARLHGGAWRGGEWVRLTVGHCEPGWKGREREREREWRQTNEGGGTGLFSTS
jgi:hypothetical protein